MAKANYDLPNSKIEEVMRLSGTKTKKEALILTIESYLARKKIEELMNAEGKFSFTWKSKSLEKYRK